MLVEAAFTAAKIPGPLRAFFERVRARRGTQIAIVATARKLVCLCWTMIERGEDYAFARQSLTDKKLRALELRAGMPSSRGRKGNAAHYSLKEVRRRELDLAEQAEHAYRQQVADWQAKGPRNKNRAWPPPTGRERKGPLRGKLRGRHQSQNLRFARGSTTPSNQPKPRCRTPATPFPLDIFIRGVDHATDLRRERQKRGHVFPGV